MSTDDEKVGSKKRMLLVSKNGLRGRPAFSTSLLNSLCLMALSQMKALMNMSVYLSKKAKMHWVKYLALLFQAMASTGLDQPPAASLQKIGFATTKRAYNSATMHFLVRLLTLLGATTARFYEVTWMLWVHFVFYKLLELRKIIAVFYPRKNR